MSHGFSSSLAAASNERLIGQLIHGASQTLLKTLALVSKPKVKAMYLFLLQPRRQSGDTMRREFMVNVLLCGLGLIAAFRLLCLIVHPGQIGFDQEEDSLLAGSIFLLITFGLWRLSRAGYYSLAAFSLLALLALEAIRLTLQWSFELPISELMYALVIVVAGIVLTIRWALVVSSLLGCALLIISYYQISGHLRPRVDWLKRDFQMADALSYIAVIGIIALVSWLTNREINQSLARTLKSEAALADERDILEAKFIQRSRELQEIQLLRIKELQRFAEFGRLSANLVHELGNPLTAASLNLAQLSDQNSHLVQQAQQSLQQLERYIDAARNQVRHHGNKTFFSVHKELNQIACIMLPIARHANVELIVNLKDTYRLHGDPIKFDQLIANLIANAIDSYKSHDNQNKSNRIQVTIERRKQWLELNVQDWGKGIAAAEIPHLFDPFYTTKIASERSLGIGLTMSKRIVEEFHGSITVKSSLGQGTIFSVRLRLYDNSKKGAKS